jgi:hypothetical protein
LGVFGVTPRLMLKCLTSREWKELQIFCQREPVGYDRADWHAARIAQTMASGKLDEHFPPRIEPKREQTPEEMLAALGGTLIPHGNPQQTVDPD